jgi:hypothetical protein
MAQGWRITTINGLLLALYFVPVWTLAAYKIVVFPIRGIYERANIGPVLYVNDTFQLSILGTVRFAWLLVLAKFVVISYFLLFAVLTLRREGGKRAAGDEALAFALLLGSILSVASMMAASSVGEAAALRLHATESLMLLGGFALLVIDSQSFGVPRRDGIASEARPFFQTAMPRNDA